METQDESAIEIVERQDISSSQVVALSDRLREGQDAAPSKPNG
jgi:hypothetical protein